MRARACMQEIEKELEVREKRIRQIRTFGTKSEVNYERGYIACLKWVLGNFKQLKASKDVIVWKLSTETPNDVNYDEGCKKAMKWAHAQFNASSTSR